MKYKETKKIIKQKRPLESVQNDGYQWGRWLNMYVAEDLWVGRIAINGWLDIWWRLLEIVDGHFKTFEKVWPYTLLLKYLHCTPEMYSLANVISNFKKTERKL